MTIDDNNCLCGSGLSYLNCCGPLHSGEQIANTAEELMRSRFTAYAKQNAHYLLATWDKDHRPAHINFSNETAQWQKLKILGCKKGGKTDAKGSVEFEAYYLQDGIAYFMREISRFVKNGSNWLYLDGIIKATGRAKAEISAGRNSPCSCGSGKKFKHCCER